MPQNLLEERASGEACDSTYGDIFSVPKKLWEPAADIYYTDRPSTSESDTGAGGLTSNQTTVAERTPISCINCASAKTRCDKRVPCSRCEEKGFLPCEARFATKANRKSIAPRIQYPQVVQATAGTPRSLTEPTVPADVAGDTGESKKIDIEREKHDAQLAVPSNIPIACINCANAKTYCDKRVPCTRCQGNGLPCEARFAKRRNRLFPSFKPNEVSLAMCGL